MHWAALTICVVFSCEIWFQSCEASIDSSASPSLNRTLETDFWGVGVLTGDVDGNRSKYKQRLIFSWSHTELLVCLNRPGEMMAARELCSRCVWQSHHKIRQRDICHGEIRNREKKEKKNWIETKAWQLQRRRQSVCCDFTASSRTIRCSWY